MTTATLYLLLPEMVLIAAAVAIYLGGAFSPGKGDSPHLCEAPSGLFRQMGTVRFFPTGGTFSWIAGGAILAAAVLLWANMVLPTPLPRCISMNWPGLRDGWPSAFGALLGRLPPFSKVGRHSCLP